MKAKVITAIVFTAIISTVYGLGFLFQYFNGFSRGFFGCLGIGFLIAAVIALAVYLSAGLILAIYEFIESWLSK